MRKLQVMLCSAVFSAAALGGVSVAFADDEPAAVQPAADAAAQDPAAADSQAPAVDTPADAATSQSANVAGANQPSDAADDGPADAADPYSVKSFFADFTHFTVGDTVPALYRSKKYEVTQWTVRHLPAPVADSHWTYMGGNYVMITNADGKILKAESGEIYYKH